MDKAVLVGVAAVLITIITGFGSIAMRLGRLELKIDTMWNWYCAANPGPKPGGRRRHDPPADDAG